MTSRRWPSGSSKYDAAAAVVAVDFSGPDLAGVGPVTEPALADPRKDRIEVFLADEEGVVLGGNLAVGLVEVERDAVAEVDNEERPESGSSSNAARKVADFCLLRHDTMVWSSSTLTSPSYAIRAPLPPGSHRTATRTV